MKKNIALSLALSAIFVSSVYAATDHNTITFSGMVKETTCTITSSEGNAADFTVKLPTYAPSQFIGTGKIETSKKSFSITATGPSCNNTSIYLSSAVSTEDGIINATEAQSGKELAIQVQTDKGVDVAFNNQFPLAPSTTVGQSQANYAFNAYYRGVSAADVPAPGTYEGIATYIVANN